MDVLTKKQRSYNMSRIRSKNTSIELIVFSALRKRKIYFQKHYSRLPGKPDIAVPSKKLAVFIDGSFWHGYGFKKLELRLTPFWREKIKKNILRDRKRRAQIKNMGWSYLRVWEHELKRDFEGSIEKIGEFLKG